MALQPTAQPGVFVGSDGEKIKLVEWRDDWRYDSVVVWNGTTPMPAGIQFVFFRDLGGKDPIDINISQARRLSAGEEMIIKYFGLHFSTRAPGGTEIIPLNFKWAAERLYLNFKINKQDVAEGPAMCFQTGLGVSGYTSQATTSILSNGVPSMAAVRPLLVEQKVTSERDLDASLTHSGADWIQAGGATTYVGAANLTTMALGISTRFMLNGFIKKALGRGI